MHRINTRDSAPQAHRQTVRWKKICSQNPVVAHVRRAGFPVLLNDDIVTRLDATRVAVQTKSASGRWGLCVAEWRSSEGVSECRAADAGQAEMHGWKRRAV